MFSTAVLFEPVGGTVGPYPVRLTHINDYRYVFTENITGLLTSYFFKRQTFADVVPVDALNEVCLRTQTHFTDRDHLTDCCEAG